jgi:hypothetical protein
MKKNPVLLICLLLSLFSSRAWTQEEQRPAAPGKGTMLANLRTPEELEGVLFGWDSLPDWLITDVVFGIQDGELVFAKYTATAPGGQPVVHDRRNEVDWVIKDTSNLPGPIHFGTANGDSIEVSRFTIGVRADGRAVIDTLEGKDAAGRPFSMQASAADLTKAPGLCGAPVVLGKCNATFCTGSCAPDFQDSDPCDCTGNGFCTDGTAIIACPTGTCPGICVFQLGLCGCFPNVQRTSCIVTPGSSSVALTVQNNQVGIAEIRVTEAVNVNVNISSFSPGTTAPINVTATKQILSERSRIQVAVIDTIGGVTPCDPVLTLVIRDVNKPVTETLSDIPREESKIAVTNGSPGVRQLFVTVNGVRFRLSNLKDREKRSLDVSSAMVPGNTNVISLSATGKKTGSAFVLIHD